MKRTVLLCLLLLLAAVTLAKGLVKKARAICEKYHDNEYFQRTLAAVIVWGIDTFRIGLREGFITFLIAFGIATGVSQFIVFKKDERDMFEVLFWFLLGALGLGWWMAQTDGNWLYTLLLFAVSVAIPVYIYRKYSKTGNVRHSHAH